MRKIVAIGIVIVMLLVVFAAITSTTPTPKTILDDTVSLGTSSSLNVKRWSLDLTAGQTVAVSVTVDSGDGPVAVSLWHELANGTVTKAYLSQVNVVASESWEFKIETSGPHPLEVVNGGALTAQVHVTVAAKQ